MKGNLDGLVASCGGNGPEAKSAALTDALNLYDLGTLRKWWSLSSLMHPQMELERTVTASLNRLVFLMRVLGPHQCALSSKQHSAACSTDGRERIRGLRDSIGAAGCQEMSQGCVYFLY